MPKSLRHVYDELSCLENLYQAYVRARKGKRFKEPAAWFEMQLEDNLVCLHKQLVAQTYRPGSYRHFYIHDPKTRLISAAPFRDRVVHHAVVSVLEPYYERRFSHASFACRKGMGTHRAMESAHWGIRNHPWFLKGDIVKFYPSVDHEALKRLLFAKIDDARLHRLLELIIDSGKGVLDEEAPAMWFAGDDLLTPCLHARGLPIGNLTSQFFANVLLNELDQFVHREIKPRHYVRYMDDFLLFDCCKQKLCDARPRIESALSELRLRLHPRKSCVRASSQGVRYLGFKLTPVTRRLARENLSRFRRRMKGLRKGVKAREVPIERVTASVRGWLAHTAHGNTKAVVRGMLADVRV